MATANEEALKTLNQLIETCKDGENGFQAAAGGVTLPELKSLFESYASQRGHFAGELQAEVQRLGGQPEKSGHVTATLHRAWVNIKSLVTGRDEAAIIAECESGEDAAVKAYEDALKNNLPAETRTLVQRQFKQIKEAHDRVRALKVAAKT